jgi:hypothetical protein
MKNHQNFLLEKPQGLLLLEAEVNGRIILWRNCLKRVQ